MSKGSKRRPESKSGSYRKGYDRIFKKPHELTKKIDIQKWINYPVKIVDLNGKLTVERENSE